MAEYKYYSTLNNLYDLNLLRNSGERIFFDSISDLRYEACLIQHDIRPFHLYRSPNLLDSDSYAGFLSVNGMFDIRGMQFEILPQWIDADSYQCGASFSFGYDFYIWQKNGVSQLFDAIDAWGVQRTTGFSWQHDLIVAVRTAYRFPFDSLLYLNPRARFAFEYDILKLYREKIPIRWDLIPCDFLARQNILFNSNRQEFALLPVYRQSLVRPGWKILARNLLTDTVSELGFIDQLAVGSQSASPSNQHVLEGIFLPDGEYEISVLTSSLFWKDAVNHDVRTIVVGPNEELSPLPTIYNLRSAVQGGATIIQWSATKSEVEDCLFGIWYSSESPVDTNRPSDATVWYSTFMTEYQTSFEQNAPAYVAVAALRPGNESEKGKVHELFLDWSSVPPRAPDDVVLLPEALPVFDPEIVDRAVEEEDLALVF